MQIKPSRCALLTAALAGVSFCAIHSQSNHGVDISSDDHGSVPPVSQWFKCFRELRDKPYDKTKSQMCLASLLSHSQINKGRIIFKRYKNRDLLTFRLESPSLKVSDVEYDVEAGELAQLHNLIETHGNTLVVGEPYDENRAGSSLLVLDVLNRSRGRRAGISTTTYLDYRRKTARVVFKMWDGPPGEPERLTPPYAEPCKIMNANFNSLDVDDFSPVEFVEQQMKTKWLGCFSESDVQDDLVELRNMKFLKEANISIDGSGETRTVTVHLRGNPIAISEVKVRGYGLLEGLADSGVPPLTIHAGEIYSRSATNNQLQSLENSFSKGERRVTSFSDVRITSGGKAELDFSVFACPDDVVYIDGMKFDNSLHDH